jgi:hypothetical protein
MERRHHLFSQLRIRYSGFSNYTRKNETKRHVQVKDKTYILLADVEM